MRTADGPVPMETTYTWEPAGASATRMTLRNRGNHSGFSRVAAPIVARAMHRATTKDRARLKALLESGWCEGREPVRRPCPTVTSEATPTPSSGRVPDAMRIGEVAARTELSLPSLRHWDEVGLLRPSGRSDGGFRLYTEGDVEKTLVIRRMKPLGFTLDQMSAAMRDIECLDDSEPDDARGAAARERLAVILREAAGRREDLARQLDMADEFIHLLGERLA